ncbi:hypothetical protein CEUSTIGMA_g4370.t1 [Chlamydomonas eustigma]|uniref:Trafficking protein particle complex subunit 11 domain-containing protein n=1 Tax=Chlamydomonas eustigma TaxID=1157962 RepID=A0A250X1F6_9CHLO|nr:hypothetical protein CEUSTIGMA_g4370.t1 [Chlamydomonas eustigma]|eukprot:GAX76923.1 hypothetical protein CEUSTIGMA_g4370.t1 [Chlamydomonas eustigma]
MGSSVQSLYPLEYRTPPLPLVALVGCNEAHKDVADFFVHQLKPPLVSLFTTAEATEQFVARNFGPGKRGLPPSVEPPPGILKADWLSKHRGKKPAVALVLVPRQDIDGDPSSWSRMLQLLRLVSDAVSQSGAGLVIGVLQGPDAGELPSERVTGVCHNLSLDPRVVMAITAQPVDQDPGRAKREAGLRLLGAVLHEQCSLVYSRRAARVTAKLAERQAGRAVAALELVSPRRNMPWSGSSSSLAGDVILEYSIRASFKLASYSEFRQEWQSAVQEYHESYSLLSQAVEALPRSPSLPSQRWQELSRCAELMNLKLLMLLMHQGILDEATAQAQRHLQLFADPGADALPAPSRSNHLAYLVRQYQVIAEVVCLRADAAVASGGGGQAASAATLMSRDLSRPLLLLKAAELAVERRRLCEVMKTQPPPQQQLLLLHQQSPTTASAVTSSPPSGVRRGAYLGQLVVRAGGGGTRQLSSAEFLAHIRAEETGQTGAASSASPAGSRRASSSGTSSSGRTAISTLPDPAVSFAIDAINSALASLALRAGAVPSSSASRPGAATSAAVGNGAGAGSFQASVRLRSRLSLMLAKEHSIAGNFSAARKLLLQACSVYRRECWWEAISQCLQMLLEVSGNLRLFSEQAVYTLELAALGTSCSSSRSIHENAALEAARDKCGAYLTALASGSTEIVVPGSSSVGSIINGCPSGVQAAPREYHFVVEMGEASPSLTDQQQQQRGGGGQRASVDGSGALKGMGGADVVQKHQQDFGWWRCLAVALGSPQLLPDSDSIDLHLAFWSLLPVPLYLAGGVKLVLEDELGQWEVGLVGVRDALVPPAATNSIAKCTWGMERGDHASHNDDDALPGRDADIDHNVQLLESLQIGAGKQGAQVQPPHTIARGMEGAADGGGSCSPLSLSPGCWERAVVRVAPRCVGHLNVAQVILVISEQASVTFRASTFFSSTSPASSSASLGDLHTLLQLPDPFGGPGTAAVREGTWKLHFPHLGPLPRVTTITEAAPLPAGTSGQAAAAALVSEQAPVTFVVENPGHVLEGAVMEFAVRLGPGMSQSDITLTVDCEGRLANLPLDGQGRIPLPSTAGGGGRQAVRTWLRSTRPGRVALTALLLCPSPLPTTIELVYEEPFEYRTQISAEAGVHTLTPPRLPGPGSPPSGVTPITIGQPVLLHTFLRGLQSAELELIEAKLLPNSAAGLTPVSDLSSQLAGWPEILGQGEVVSLLLPLMPTRASMVPISLGGLQVKWCRRQKVKTAGSESLSDGASNLIMTERKVGEVSGEGASFSLFRPSPDALVTTLLDLPLVTVGDSLLTVRTVGPAHVTAGIAFTNSLQVRNFSHHAVELLVSLLDSPGFVLSGERTQGLTVGPRDSGSCMWLLVAHTAGYLPLPIVRVVASRLNCTLSTQSMHVNVAPF